jgi:hypothetical protein
VEAADLGTDVAIGDRVERRSVEDGDAPVLHGDVKTAGIRTVERAHRRDEMSGGKNRSRFHVMQATAAGVPDVIV